MAASPGRGSQRKGAAGERELVRTLREHGYVVARTEGSGRFGGGDIEGLKGVHLEAKRQETTKFYAWYEQARRDRGLGKAAVVAHRRNQGEWMVFLSLEDFMKLYSQIHPPLFPPSGEAQLELE